MYKAIIFDMDGTILDTLEDLAYSLNYALKKNNLPTRTIKEVRSMIGNGIYVLCEKGVPKGTSKTTINKVFTDLNEHYAIHCSNHTGPYDGIKDLLKDLHHQGLLTAVVSNKADYAVQSLCKDYFDGDFNVALGLREGFNKKPAPDTVNEVLRLLDVSKEEAVYIGDSEVDIETCLNVPMECIIVDWGFRDREFLVEHGAKVIVSSVNELKEYLTQKQA